MFRQFMGHSERLIIHILRKIRNRGLKFSCVENLGAQSSDYQPRAAAMAASHQPLAFPRRKCEYMFGWQQMPLRPRTEPRGTQAGVADNPTIDLLASRSDQLEAPHLYDVLVFMEFRLSHDDRRSDFRLMKLRPTIHCLLLRASADQSVSIYRTSSSPLLDGPRSTDNTAP